MPHTQDWLTHTHECCTHARTHMDAARTRTTAARTHKNATIHTRTGILRTLRPPHQRHLVAAAAVDVSALTSVPWLALPESFAPPAPPAPPAPLTPSAPLTPAAVPLMPSWGFVASNNTLRDAIACSWVAFSSTLPEIIKHAKKISTICITRGLRRPTGLRRPSKAYEGPWKLLLSFLSVSLFVRQSASQSDFRTNESPRSILAFWLSWQSRKVVNTPGSG